MNPPRAVVIPFGVPDESRGLGLGLAALVHTCVQIQGEGVAIAQLHSRKSQGSSDAGLSPVEAFVSPTAWREIAGRGDKPMDVGLVLTGALEPPVEGSGTIHLLAFDAHDGRTRADLDVALDGEGAGTSLVEALEELWANLGGDIGALRSLRDLEWEPLESVLFAERCALHDPARGGPHDRLAAMLHLGRAIGEAPAARYPVDRLASIALDTVAGPTQDPKLTAAAVRALERAALDASTNLDVIEPLAALLIRRGRPEDAERRMNAAIAIAPRRVRPYSLLAQALRAQGKLDGALAVLQAGAAAAGSDRALTVERGVVLAASGDLEGAALAWREVLATDPLQREAYVHLAALALRSRDTATAQTLVDSALASPAAPVDVLRSAVQLVQNTEAEGLPRASRLLRLGERWLEREPHQPSALMVIARSLLALGQPPEARARLDEIERVAPRSAAAAEAQAMRLALDEPAAHLEVQSVLRAARMAPVARLADVTARARRLGTLHSAWGAWLAASLAEGRRGRWDAARSALHVGVDLAPGAVPVHLELGRVLIELGAPDAAIERAQIVMALEGPSPATLGVLARALAAAGRSAEAIEAATGALAMQPDDASTQALLRALRSPKRRSGWGQALARLLKGAAKT